VTPAQILDKIEGDPFWLRTIDGIGWKTCDLVRRRLNIADTDPRRLQAGIIHSLETAAEKGSTAWEASSFAEHAAKLLGVNPSHINQDLINSQIKLGAVAEFDGAYCLPELGYAEALVAEWCALACTQILPALPIHLTGSLALSEDQEAAVRLALSAKLCIVTGGPGTGKTTITREIVHSLRENEQRVLLASPTGRAADRLQQAASAEAMTTYRLLGYSPFFGGFTYNAKNLLDADAVLIDEVSMVGVEHMWDILQAIPEDCRVTLVGDADQLPSVSAGRVLQDLLESEAIPSVRLEKIFRQAEGSKIVTNAHRIRKGMTIESGTTTKDDFFVHVEDDPETAQSFLLQYACERIRAAYGIDDIQVLVPIRGKRPGGKSGKGKGHSLGCAVLNEKMRDLVNPDGLMILGGKFRIGDRVIITKNLYDIWRMNGEVGIIIAFREDAKEMDVRFENDVTTLRQRDGHFGNLELAYALTIHKSQGSQYGAVVLALHRQHWIMLQRDLFYTAVTRAEKLCVVVGDEKSIRQAIRNRGGAKRQTKLKERIRAAIENPRKYCDWTDDSDPFDGL
jgi:exodeoxyribonuclease V alpha subunit